MSKELYPSEYRSWQAMKNRCLKTNKKMRQYYYERNIVVCERWKNSFIDFLEDMGKKPTTKHTLDRIDNDKGYTPENCKWSTRQQQALNRRIYNLNDSNIVGVHYLKKSNRWRARIKVNGVSSWLGTFDKKEDAIAARKIAEQRRDTQYV